MQNIINTKSEKIYIFMFFILITIKGTKIRNMDMENISIKMEIGIKVSGKRIKEMVMG